MYLLSVNPFLIAAAVIPAILLMIIVYRMDRLEREPKGLLWSLILFGILATAVAGYLEQIGSRLLAQLEDRPILYTLIFTCLLVGPAEEGCKYLLLKRRTWRNGNFNCRFDGVVYAVFVSLGFALWENISYVAIYGIQVALIRSVTAVPGHAAFGVFMGAWYGQAKAFERAGNLQRSKTCRRLAFLVPALIHGLYDFIAILGGPVTLVIFVVFILVTFVVSFIMLRRLAKQDHYL